MNAHTKVVDLGRPNDKAVASAMRDLDSALHDAKLMAIVAEDMVEEILSSSKAEKRGTFTVLWLNNEQIDQLHFITKMSRRMIGEVLDQWEKGVKAQ